MGEGGGGPRSPAQTQRHISVTGVGMKVKFRSQGDKVAQGTVNGLSQCSGRGRGLPGASCVCPEEKGYLKKQMNVPPQPRDS